MFDDGDLFEVATSLARLLDAPVTIEDPNTVVVAYSGGEQDVDEARIGTILSRQVPVRFRDAIARAGVFDELERSDEVLVVDLPELQMVPRAVVPVRDEGRLVASIWAAVGRSPSAAQREVLRAAAPVVAAHLRLERERADSARRERIAAVADLLGGGETAEQTAERRLITGEWTVAAMRPDAAEVSHELWSALDLHLSAIAPAAVCAPLDHSVYVVLPVAGATRILTGFVERMGRRSPVVVGIGPAVDRPAQLIASRAVADQVAEVLVRRRRFGAVHDLRDAWVDVLADRATAFVQSHAWADPLTGIEQYDERHQAGLVDAVRSFLRAGEVTPAAELLHVHPNTLRKRLRRVRESCQVDLDDPDTRLALMLALRVRGPWS